MIWQIAKENNYIIGNLVAMVTSELQIESVMSNRRASTQNLSDEQCPVCRNKFANVYLKRRHMGVLHGLEKDGSHISPERREYLRRQSDRKYVPIKFRNPSSSTTSFDNMKQNGGKFELIEPTTSEYRTQFSDKSDEDMEFKLFQRMMSDCERAFNRVRMRKQEKTTLPTVTKPLQRTRYQ